MTESGWADVAELGVLDEMVMGRREAIDPGRASIAPSALAGGPRIAPVRSGFLR